MSQMPAKAMSATVCEIKLNSQKFSEVENLIVQKSLHFWMKIHQIWFKKEKHFFSSLARYGRACAEYQQNVIKKLPNSD